LKQPVVYCLGLASLALLAGCGGGGSSGSSVTPPPTTPPVVSPPSPTNHPPTITGTPPTVAKVGAIYAFQPTASDPDGDALAFQISNKPAWASFDPATGQLSGSPAAANVGVTTGIVVSVSDGKVSSSLAPFDLTVPAQAVGSATLTWEPPTLNEDGTPLTNLAGYVIRYGQIATNLDQRIDVANPGATTYVVQGLLEGTWYFSLASLNTAGIESRPTGLVLKAIR
jgi:hypothetical protein